MKHSVKSVVRVCCIAVAALSFSGCSALTDRWTITTVDDTASGLAPVHYEASIKSYLETRLKDPFSAITDISRLQRNISKMSRS